jgi:5-methylcytosine-specific restriction endonuclease McrA
MIKIEYIVFIVTAVLIANTYYDGRLIRVFQSNQKLIKMVTFGFVGLSLFIFLRRSPENSRQLFVHANDIIKYMPISKGTADIITPFFDFTNNKSFFNNDNHSTALPAASTYGGSASTGNARMVDSDSGGGRPIANHKGVSTAAERRLLNSGKGSNKRSVSETKKKYVAAQQGWKCGDCQRQLPAWFEVDHVIALEHGGSNHVDNLVALCRDCHGKKTAMSFL